MSAPSDTPKWLGDQPQIPVREQASVTLADTALSSAHVHQDEWKMSELASWPEPSEKLSSEPWEDPNTVLQGRLALIFIIFLVVAMSAIFAKPIRALLNADLQTLQAPKPSDRLTVNGAPANSSVVATKIAPSSGSEPLTNATKTSAGLNGMASASSTKIKANSEVGSSVGATEIAENVKPSSGATKTAAEVESSIGVTKTTVGSEASVHRRDKNYSGHGAVRNRAGATSAAATDFASARARTEDR